jgi:hypothetical protein
MKNNLFKISSLNIYENSLNKFLKFEKSLKKAKQTLENRKNPFKEKKTENKTVKQNTKPYRKKYWTRTGPRPISLRSRAEQTKARPRAEHRNRRLRLYPIQRMLRSARALGKLRFAKRCESWDQPIKFVPAGSFGRCTRNPRTTCLTQSQRYEDALASHIKQ